VRNLKITLAYDGSDYYGWQVQPDRETVQGTLAAAIERVTGSKVLPQASGRTDAGVHALAQVASCQLNSGVPTENLSRALNHVLPAAIRVTEAVEVAPDFHARKSARAKTYCYRIYRGQICPPFLARYVCHFPYSLQEEPMRDAATVVLGEHDFTSFAAVDPERGREEAGWSNVRTMYSSEWTRQGEEFVYTLKGSGFLQHMVRNFVGTFLLVGKGTLDCGGVKRILVARDRSLAGPTAPACGLYLVSVEY
jgi:tRNA pseudouridine38-40 synthase